jgi:hypothetical protein
VHIPSRSLCFVSFRFLLWIWRYLYGDISLRTPSALFKRLTAWQKLLAEYLELVTMLFIDSMNQLNYYVPWLRRNRIENSLSCWESEYYALCHSRVQTADIICHTLTTTLQTEFYLTPVGMEFCLTEFIKLYPVLISYIDIKIMHYVKQIYQSRCSPTAARSILLYLQPRDCAYRWTTNQTLGLVTQGFNTIQT